MDDKWKQNKLHELGCIDVRFCTVKGVVPKWVSICEGKRIMSRLLKESVVAKDQHNIMI